MDILQRFNSNVFLRRSNSAEDNNVRFVLKVNSILLNIKYGVRTYFNTTSYFDFEHGLIMQSFPLHKIRIFDFKNVACWEAKFYWDMRDYEFYYESFTKSF